MLFFGKKCHRCGRKNIKIVKPSLWKKWQDASIRLVAFPISILKQPLKNLNVCRDCGFSWEDR